MGQDNHDKGLGRKSKRAGDPAPVAASAPKVARTSEAGPASQASSNTARSTHRQLFFACAGRGSTGMW